MAIYKIVASRVNNITATEFTGQENELGQIWYDPVEGILRLYDSNTGGKIINGGGNVAFPPQAGNANAYLTTNGSNVLWRYLPGAFGLELDGGNAQTELEFVIDGGGA